MKSRLSKVARAVVGLFGTSKVRAPEPVKVLPLPPLCSVDAMHDWEARWDHEAGTVAYWACNCCGEIRESFE